MSKLLESQSDYEDLLRREGLGEDAIDGNIFPGKQEPFGDGLGRKTGSDEELEDSGEGHSSMCPLHLGYALDDSIDQPLDDPTADQYDLHK